METLIAVTYSVTKPEDKDRAEIVMKRTVRTESVITVEMLKDRWSVCEKTYLKAVADMKAITEMIERIEEDTGMTIIDKPVLTK